MQIGEMFVRITADPSGMTSGTQTAIRQMLLLEKTATRTIGALGSTAAKSHLSMGLLSRELLTVARNATGVSPIVAQLANVFGQFAVGSVAMAAILGGLALLSFAYTKLTADTRALKKETEDAAKALDALGAKREGGQGELIKNRDIAQQNVDRLGAEIKRRQEQLSRISALNLPGVNAKGAIAELHKLSEEQQVWKTRLHDANDELRDAIPSIEGVGVSVKKVASFAERLAAATKGLDFGFGAALDKRLGVTRAEPQPEWVKKILALSPTRITTPPTPASALEGQGTIGQVLGDVGGQLRGAVKSLVAVFGPMAIVGEFLNGVFAALAPVLDALLVPIRDIGFLLGGVIAPVLKLLQPILNTVAKAFSFVIQGIGEFIKGLGKAINFLLPGNPANGLVKAGQGMIDLANQTRAAIDAGTDLTKTISKVSASMSNVPEIFELAARRRAAGRAGDGASFDQGAFDFIRSKRPAGGITIHINNPPAGLDTKRVAKQVVAAITDMRRQGGTTEVDVALAG